MNLYQRWSYLGHSENLLSKYGESINKSNLDALYVIVRLFLCITSASIVFKLLVNPISYSSVLVCASATVASIIFCCICYKLRNSDSAPNTRLVNMLLEVASLMCYACTIFLGTFGSDNDFSVTAILMLAFMQMIFIMQPERNAVIVCLALLFFYVCSGLTKDTYHFIYDLCHGLIAVGLGSFMSWTASKIRLDIIIADSKLRKSNYDLYHASTTDALTGLFNRKLTFDKLEEFYTDSRKTGACINCIVIDIDYFKDYNDFYGHPGGDAVLNSVGAALKEYGDKNDVIIGRIGGEEFMAISTDSSVEQGEVIAEDLRKAVFNLGITHEKSKVCGVVTISLGLCSDTADVMNNSFDLYDSADHALYKAKEEGKNCSWQYRSDTNKYNQIG